MFAVWHQFRAAGSSGGAAPKSTPQMQATHNAANELTAALASITRAWRDGRTSDLAQYFHPEMVIVGPGFAELCRGRDACVDSYREFGASAVVREYTEGDLSANVWNDAAVVTYHWSMKFDREGVRNEESGRDQFVFVRQGDRWLAVWRFVDFTPPPVAQ